MLSVSEILTDKLVLKSIYICFMRKLTLQMQVTADGFVAGPNGELDWMSQDVDALQLKQLKQLTESMDTILMGRKMADGFTSYWEHVVDNQPDSAEYAYAKIFVDTPKIIFSNTVNNMRGRNVRVENGDLVTTVTALKNLEGKDMIVYGGAAFVAGLLECRLIDDLHLFVNPVAIGEGLPIFRRHLPLKLISSLACTNGIVINHYQPAG